MKKFVTINKNGIKKSVDVNVYKKKIVLIILFFNVVNCSCEMKKHAALIEEEECDIETSEKIECENKIVTLTKKIGNCKPFVTSSILFVCVSVILTGIMIYFCLKSKNNVLSY